MERKTVRLEDLIKVTNSLYEIPRTYDSNMRVPARIFIDEEMLLDALQDNSLAQIVNVATLPGIQKYAYAMPDIHQGYGFPIGGVAAFAAHEGGIISPGGIGYDINCGVRLLAVSMTADQIRPYLEQLATDLFNTIPSGVGSSGKIKLSEKELDKVLKHGARYMLDTGYGTLGDIDYCEEKGSMDAADPDMLSDRAKKRGLNQLGTLGSGNHFLEVQEVTEIYNEGVARTFGLEVGMVTVMIHCGSRGLGHQTCTDYVKMMVPKLDSWSIQLPDRELACAPINSQEGRDYYAAMCAAANYAWANRHVIGHWVRERFKAIVGDSVTVRTIYDLSHNMGKKEKHWVDGIEKELLVHRKGATRAFPAGRPELPSHYQTTGHPVLIPGTMGTASYVLVGTEEGLENSFGSSCHGAGRKLSRSKAKKTVRGSTLREELQEQGIIIRCKSDPGLAEEAPMAYKDVDNVVQVTKEAHLAKPVAKLKPLAVIKG